MQIGRRMAELFTALLLAAVILFSTALAAQQVIKSNLYRQSRFLTMIISQDSVDLRELVASTDTVRFVTKFASAVTSAYISFELIPVNEVSTFLAIFDSLDEGVSVDRFSYQRRDITIYGEADDKAAYDRFLEALRETEHFSGVSGRYYISTADTVKFEAVCYANTVGYLEQFNN